MHNFKVLKNDGEFRVCDHRYKLAFTRVTVVRQSDLNSLPFRKFKFADFSNVIASDFQTGLLVGRFTCNLGIYFDRQMYGFKNDMSLLFASLRYYWCGWWSGVPACLLKKYQGSFPNQGLEVMLYNLTFLNLCNCYLYFVNIISWYTDTFIVVCFW